MYKILRFNLFHEHFHQVHECESDCKVSWNQAGVSGAPSHSFRSVGADQDQATGLEETLHLPGGCQGVAARVACQ